MNTGFLDSDPIRWLVEGATCKIARLANRPTTLLRLVGDGPTASSRLVRQPPSRSLGRIQPRLRR